MIRRRCNGSGASRPRSAIIIGVCVGAKVVGEAGLLHGKRATTHWYSSRNCARSIRRCAMSETAGWWSTTAGDDDRNHGFDADVADADRGDRRTRQGATPSAGRSVSPDWDARHDSDAFKFTRPFALTAIGNTAAFWNHEQLGIELKPGVDEVSLALVTDAWSAPIARAR